MVPSCVLQPALELVVQLAQPLAQVRLQVLAAQVALATCGSAAQSVAHVPQCWGSVCRFTHWPPQSVCPLGHSHWQVLRLSAFAAVQLGTQFPLQHVVPVPQGVHIPPFVPQAASSSRWHVRVPSQHPFGQLVALQTQTIPLQRWPEAQLLSLQAQAPSAWQTCPGNPQSCPRKLRLAWQLPVAALQILQVGQTPQVHGPQSIV